LKLANTTISDGAIPTLVRLTQLLSVDVSDTHMTPSGVAALRRALPGATVQADHLK
jgi:hypothetical protein